MNTFNKGDIVVRIKDRHLQMWIGDISRIEAYKQGIRDITKIVHHYQIY